MNQRLAKLVPPHMDKHHSFQMIGALPEDIIRVRVALQAPQVKAVRPFLQGESRDWVMVEFWSDDLELIQIAAKHLADCVDLDLLHGNFDRSELGFN